MQVIEKNSLFAQVSGEQSAVVSGGTGLEFLSGAIFSIVADELNIDDKLTDLVTILFIGGVLRFPELNSSAITPFTSA
ncbi:hypothetical protein [Cylindrospermopsis curvispora]|uniref:Uncharacterized protein n=1 Tax=Cylindrospermopsis curvispora GIHE-G1 TaxID=2666332 RepID=A0A7H0F422_9CYAN|nr:hypothetical protein [Cylindrospermopsis curvispora]QNP30788.1 hypothetical protein IAR63_07325 [Cylindrospermopsis curvispora GIHE-G1]